MTLDRAPSNAGLLLTVVASLLVIAGTQLAGWGLAALGVPLAAGGVYRNSRRLLAVAVGVLFLGTVLASTNGVSTASVLVAMAGTVLTWDVGENTISLVEQLGGQARTARIEVAHALTSSVVVAGSGGGAFVVYLVASGDLPGTTLLLAMVGLGIAVATFQR